jgi:hypothetical protein
VGFQNRVSNTRLPSCEVEMPGGTDEPVTKVSAPFAAFGSNVRKADLRSFVNGLRSLLPVHRGLHLIVAGGKDNVARIYNRSIGILRLHARP